MISASVADRVAGVFQQVFNDDALQPSLESTPDDIPGWDSVMHVTLIFSLEDEFGIELEEVAHAEVTTVGDLCALIERQLPRL